MPFSKQLEHVCKCAYNVSTFILYQTVSRELRQCMGIQIASGINPQVQDFSVNSGYHLQWVIPIRGPTGTCTVRQQVQQKNFRVISLNTNYISEFCLYPSGFSTYRIRQEKCDNTVIVIGEKKYLGLISEKKDAQVYNFQWFNLIYNSGNESDTRCFMYFMYFDQYKLPLKVAIHNFF